MLECPLPSSRTTKDVGPSSVTYSPLQSPLGVRNTWYSTPVFTVSPKTASMLTTASPFDNCPEPASSNQCSGELMVFNATLREPPACTAAAMFPLQTRSPFTSIVQEPP